MQGYLELQTWIEQVFTSVVVASTSGIPYYSVIYEVYTEYCFYLSVFLETKKRQLVIRVVR